MVTSTVLFLIQLTNKLAEFDTIYKLLNLPSAFRNQPPTECLRKFSENHPRQNVYEKFRKPTPNRMLAKLQKTNRMRMQNFRRKPECLRKFFKTNPRQNARANFQNTNPRQNAYANSQHSTRKHSHSNKTPYRFDKLR